MMLKGQGSYHTLTRCFIKQYNAMAKNITGAYFQKLRRSFSALSKEVTHEIFTETFYHASTVYSKPQKEK